MAEERAGRAEAAVRRAEARMQRAEAAVQRDISFLPMYTAAQQGYIAAQQAYLAAQHTATLAITIQAAPDAWEGSRAVQELLKYYGEVAKTARSIKAHQNELDLKFPDLGEGNFEVLGREEAYEAMLQGVGSMFRNFIRPRLDFIQQQRRGVCYFTMVAFSGAGKTTLGRRVRELLSMCWNTWPDGKKQASLGLEDADYEQFKCMAASTLEYDLCMFHTVAHNEGCIVAGERGLDPAQILALRCLYSIIHREAEKDAGLQMDYTDFVSDLDRKCPRLKLHLRLADVLDFLRLALGVHSDTWLLPSFFFDELNAISRTMDGQSAGPDDPTWFESVMSQYLRDTHKLALSKARTLPVVTLASTWSSAKSIDIARVRAQIIPVRPLTLNESRLVVLGFANKVAESLQEPPVEKLGKWVEDFLLTVAGGMPRLLGLGLGSICSATDWRTLLRYLTEDCVSYDNQKRILTKWEHEASAYFGRYWIDEAMQPLLLRALAASLLGKEVLRDTVILSEYDKVPQNLWGSLEDAGLVSLTRGGSAVDVGSVAVPVRCNPFLVKKLVNVLEQGLHDLSARDPMEKGKADACAVLLRAYLNDASYGCLHFHLMDVLPRGSLVPRRLRNHLFKLRTRKYTLDVAHERQGDIKRLKKRARDGSALLVPGSLGGDSFIFCEMVEPEQWAGKEVTFVLQSKKTISDASELVSSLETNFKDDIGLLFPLPKEVSMDDQGRYQDREVDQDGCMAGEGDGNEYVYIFNTNRPITEDLKTKIELLQSIHPYFTRSVFCFEQESVEHGDAISVLNWFTTCKLS